MKPPITDSNLQCLITRRAYIAPSLMCYGFVHDLTQAGTTGPSESANPCIATEFTHKPNPSCTMSDLRLKTNIWPMSTTQCGLGLYLFEYKAEYKAECGHGSFFGYMAQEVLQKYPSAVVTCPDGYLAIDYCRLRQLLH